MKTSILICLSILIVANLFSQNIYELKITKQNTQNRVCPSNFDDCGGLVFRTKISGLKFESDMLLIKTQKLDTEENEHGKKYTYYIETKAERIQHIIISGNNLAQHELAEYDLTVYDLVPGTCQDFIINYVTEPPPPDTVLPVSKLGSLYLNTIPAKAKITLEGNSKFKEFTPFLFENYEPDTYKVKLEKKDYESVETSFVIVANEISEKTVNLKPLGQDLKIYIKKHKRRQGLWAGGAIVSAGIGTYFALSANQKYDEYKNSTDPDEINNLKETIELYDILAPSFFVVAGFCTVEFIIQTAKKGKKKKELNLLLNGQTAQLTYKF